MRVSSPPRSSQTSAAPASTPSSGERSPRRRGRRSARRRRARGRRRARRSPPRQTSSASTPCARARPRPSIAYGLVPVATQRGLEDVAAPRVGVGDQRPQAAAYSSRREPVGHLGELEDATRLAVAGSDDERAALLACPHIGVEHELQTGRIEERDVAQIEDERSPAPRTRRGGPPPRERGPVDRSSSPRTTIRRGAGRKLAL